MKYFFLPIAVVLLFLPNILCGQTSSEKASNPLIYADIPEMSIVRVDDTYYMSSTTMHLVPGVPIMKSKDLANWELVNYVYDKLSDEIPSFLMMMVAFI